MQIIVKLTNQCNLRCIYCSEGDPVKAEVLELALLHKMIDEIPDLLEAVGEKEITFLWHGGEPLLFGKEKLVEAMEYAFERLKQYPVKFIMQSNGYAIDDEWLDIFEKYNVSVGMSLDGYKELHDANRPTADGKGSFDRVVGNIRKMQERGMKVGTLMVLNGDSAVDVDKLMGFLEELKSSVKIHPVVSCGRADGRADIDSVNESYLILMKRLYERSLAVDSEIEIEPLKQIIEAILGLHRVNECSYNGTCGSNFICVYSDGRVGVCGRRINDNELSYGSLRDRTLLDLYNSAKANEVRARDEYLQAHDCKACEYWYLCHGGCTFEAVVDKGSIFNKFGQCKTRKALLRYLTTEGLASLKQRLIHERNEYRAIIKEKKKFLRNIQHA